MSNRVVTVVSTGAANLASVFAGFRRLGAHPRLCESAQEIETTPYVVLPGVGAFNAAVEQLTAQGYWTPLKQRLAAGRPTLAVCLGLQLLCEASEEAPGYEGLGLLPCHVRRFPDNVRTPQFGWNLLTADAGSTCLQTGYAYFANSYRILTPPEGWRSATAIHGAPFVAAVERGAVLGCQFHPELSGVWGQALLERWLKANDAEGDQPC